MLFSFLHDNYHINHFIEVTVSQKAILVLQIPFYYPLAKGYCHHVCVCLSVCPSLYIVDNSISISHTYICQIIDTDVLMGATILNHCASITYMMWTSRNMTKIKRSQHIFFIQLKYIPYKDLEINLIKSYNGHSLVNKNTIIIDRFVP